MFVGAPEAMACQPARNRVIDIMRAVAIVLVVFGHVQRGLFQTGEAAGVYWDTVYPVLDYFIYVFHVPVFFVTSGMLLERRPLQSLRQFAERIGRLVLLYVLWNTVNAIPAVVFAGYINRSFGRAGYLDAINPLHVNGIMWFFVALICAQTLHVLSRRYEPARWLAICAAVAVLGLDADFHGAAYGSLWLLAGAEITRLKLLDDVRLKPWQVGASLAAYLAVSALFYALGVPYVMAIPACALALYALYGLGQRFPVRAGVLTSIGKQTLAIYVMHVLVVAGLRIAFVKGLQMPPSGALIVPLTLAGVALPVAAAIALRQLNLGKWVLLD